MAAAALNSLVVVAKYLLLLAVLLCMCNNAICTSAEESSSGQRAPTQGSFQNCPPKVKLLETLPGRGWCNLRNREMGQVTALTYTECKTTPDGAYYIPDNTFAIPVKESSLKLYSDLIRDWSNYTSITSSSFSISAEGSSDSTRSSVRSGIAGSFSSDYQDTKQRQYEQKSVTSRIYVKDTIYTVQTEPTIDLDPGFKAQLLAAATQIKLNSTRKATLLLQLIVRDYGTHFLRRIDAGGILLQEDFLANSFILTNEDKISEVKAAASFLFFSAFGGSLGFSHTTTSTLTTAYAQNLKSSNVRTYGGAPLKTTMVNNTNLWIDSLPANLVAVDRFGDPLHFIITPIHFPELDLSTLAHLQKLFKNAIDDYYIYNTHVGCTSMSSPNFDYSANVDDKSCRSPYNNYTFGGSFIKCESEARADGDLCRGKADQKNFLTGDYSCQPGFQPMLLRTKSYASHSSGGWWFWQWSHESRSEVKSYWCYKHGNVSSNTGALFGGTYTSRKPNPLTQAKGCPPTYESLVLANDLRVCVGADYELGYKFSVPFGGFFSCQFGNPLYDIPVKGLKKKANQSQEYPAACPPGCSQHTAVVDDDCEIMYCVKAGTLSLTGQTKIFLPPFIDIEDLYVGDQGPEGSPGISGAGIVAICVVLVAVVCVVVVGAVGGYRRWKRTSRGAAIGGPIDPNDGSSEPLIVTVDDEEQ